MGRGMAAKGKRRPRKGSPPQEAVPRDGNNGPDGTDEVAAAAGGGKAGGFFCCYLLRSLCPRRKGHTYIGFTVNPRRRIRQHNGEIRCGAWRTKRGRPWEMVLCIYGFPTNVSALQFEWAWQHPAESLAVRKAASSFKSLGGVGNKVKLAYTMLNLPSWENLNLTVNFFSTKNTKFTAGCPVLPSHMKTVVCPMEDLQCYAEGLSSEDDKDGSDEPRDNKKPDACVGGEHHDLQPVEEEARIAGCESNIDEFDPMEWSGIVGARDTGRPRTDESSEVQPLEEEIRTAGCDVECSIDEFAYTQWSGIHKTRELDESRTSPRCSSSSWSDDGGGRIVDGVLGQASPLWSAGAGSSDDGDPLFHETDVVDLVTPVERLGRKGGKVAAICPKIIDLTSSPIIIEL